MRSAALALALAVATACTVTPPAATAAGPLKIGVLVPYTESALDSDIGASQKKAADLYLKLQGGKLAGRDIQLVYNDESSLDPATNKVRITQFIEQDHVGLLMGGAGTAAAYLLRDAAEASKIVYIDTNATGNALTRNTSPCTPSCRSTYVFRASASSWQLGEPLGEWAAKNGEKSFYLSYSDDAFGNESAAAFADGLARNGGAASGRGAVPEKTGDWAKVVAGIKAQATKNVFAAFITDDAEGFLAAWDAAGMRAAGYRLVGPGPLADATVLRVAKQAGVGIVSSFPWSPDVASAENRAFVDAFKNEYRDEDTHEPLPPDGYAEEMWTAMRALDEALKKTNGKTADATALVAALEAVSFSGPAGQFAFDKTTHNPIEDIYVREVKASAGSVANAIIDKVPKVADPGH